MGVRHKKKDKRKKDKHYEIKTGRQREKKTDGQKEKKTADKKKITDS